MKILDRFRFAYQNGLRFTFFRIFARLFYSKYRLRYNSMDWVSNADFNAYLKSIDEPGGINSGRRWMVYQLLRLSYSVPGDTAECGVYRGAGSYLICTHTAAFELKKTHHIFDSFEGLSKPVTVDGTHWREHDLTAGVDVVKQRLARFPNVEYYPGWIPTRFSAVEDRQFSFVHIDVDIYEPTKDSIEFFYSRMNKGAILLCDDYGFDSCPGATKAIDEFLKDKPEKAIALTDGGGFFIKGLEVAPSFPIMPGARQS